MRLMARIFAVVGVVVLATGVVIVLAGGEALAFGWLLIGPTPFFLTGWWLCRRRPDSAAALWLLVGGVTFLINVVVGEMLMPLVRDEPWAWVPWIVDRLADFVGLVGGLALFGLFPDGRPRRPYERRVLLVVAVVGALLPILYAITHSTLNGVANPFSVPAAASAAGVVGVLTGTFPLWLLVAVVLLALRYRRTSPSERRRIAGWSSG